MLIYLIYNLSDENFDTCRSYLHNYFHPDPGIIA